MKRDIERWNEKYSKCRLTTVIKADPLLVENASLFSGKGNALDIASGVCNNALYLASLGYDSFAVDGSYTALRIGKHKAVANKLTLHCFVADLDIYQIAEHAFDMVVVIKYLNRNLVTAIKNAMKRDGVLLFKTFNCRFLDENPSFSRKYVLSDGELIEWFRDWDCVATNDIPTNNSTQTYWVGRKR